MRLRCSTRLPTAPKASRGGRVGCTTSRIFDETTARIFDRGREVACRTRHGRAATTTWWVAGFGMQGRCVAVRATPSERMVKKAETEPQLLFTETILNQVAAAPRALCGNASAFSTGPRRQLPEDYRILTIGLRDKVAVRCATKWPWITRVVHMAWLSGDARQSGRGRRERGSGERGSGYGDDGHPPFDGRGALPQGQTILVQFDVRGAILGMHDLEGLREHAAKIPHPAVVPAELLLECHPRDERGRRRGDAPQALCQPRVHVQAQTPASNPS